MALVGIIGGSGLYELPGLRLGGRERVDTPFGEPSAPYQTGTLGELRVAFLPRHGMEHSIPPHRINYRANISGFKALGADRVVSVNASGGMAGHLAPGDLVALDQVIDLTQGARSGTFFDGDDVAHIDFTEPYCPELRTALLRGAEVAGVSLHQRGTYLCVNGPRLESRAEIAFFARTGAHVIGMTGMPEAALAREAELCFAALAVVTNHAAGLGREPLTTTEVVAAMQASTNRLSRLLATALPLIRGARSCPCGNALRDARMD